MSQWLAQLAHSQHEKGWGIIVENPWSSAMWKDSPFSKLLDSCIFRLKKSSQCAFEAKHPHTRLPIRKDIG